MSQTRELSPVPLPAGGGRDLHPSRHVLWGGIDGRVAGGSCPASVFSTAGGGAGGWGVPRFSLRCSGYRRQGEGRVTGWVQAITKRAHRETSCTHVIGGRVGRHLCRETITAVASSRQGRPPRTGWRPRTEPPGSPPPGGLPEGGGPSKRASRRKTPHPRFPVPGSRPSGSPGFRRDRVERNRAGTGIFKRTENHSADFEPGEPVLSQDQRRQVPGVDVSKNPGLLQFAEKGTRNVWTRCSWK